MLIGKRVWLVIATAGLMGLISVVASANVTPIANQTAGLDNSAAQGQATPWIVNGGVYVIKNASGKCLEIENSSLFDGARAQQWDCVGQAGMYWQIWGSGAGVLHIVNVWSGRCLEIENSSYNNGARAQQWDCRPQQSGANWRFSNEDVYIRNASGKCLEIENSSYNNGARAQQWDCVGQRGAQWALIPWPECQLWFPNACPWALGKHVAEKEVLPGL